VGNRATATVTFSMASPNTLTITGNITGATGSGAVNSAYGVIITGTGQLTINGNLTGGDGLFRDGLLVNAGGTLILNGNTTGAGGNARGLQITANSATVTVNGNAIGGANGGAHGLSAGANTTTTVTVNGVAINGTNPLAQGVAASGAGFITIQKAEYSGTLGPGFIGRVRFADVNDPDLLEVINASGTTVKATAGAKGKPNIRGGFAN
jgi:hypothetical protein